MCVCIRCVVHRCVFDLHDARVCVCIRCVMRRCVFDPHDAQVCVSDVWCTGVCSICMMRRCVGGCVLDV